MRLGFLDSRRKTRRIATERGGFALLITLTLLAFLLVLLVGLATYTRIESAIVGNAQRQAEARENALLALDLALAQLQKHTGPDQRITAGATHFGGKDGTRAFTGVWDTTTPSAEPVAWLVSGNEVDPLARTPADAGPATTELVGRNTSGVRNDVIAPVVELRVTGLPGQPGPKVIGRYAWWIDDEATKAAVGLPDRTSAVAYSLFESAELRARLAQQIGLGAGVAEFEPRDDRNAERAQRLTSATQLALLANPSGAVVGVNPLRENFHAWTDHTLGVLTNPRLGGLRQDLSLQPDLLGTGFAIWADYRRSMEDPLTPSSPTPLPAYAADPLRRRYRITPPVSASEAGVAPVLTYFYLLFGVRKQNATTPYTLTVRWAAGLWNPLTSALVPEGLRLEISGLPESIDFINAATNVVNASVSLRQLYGEPLTVALPWTPATSPRRAEHQSWLPGRVHNWVNLADAPFQMGTIHPGRFNSRDLGGFADGLLVSVPGTSAVNGSTPLSLRVNSDVTLTVRLVRASDGAVLATYTSPTYGAVAATAPDDANRNRSQLGYLFRLAEGIDNVMNPGAWLITDGIDPRQPNVPAAALRAVPNGPNPAAYANYITISAPDRLFDRDITRGSSYNEDAPLFEMPRAPLLSLGALQHLHLPGSRAFAIGNPWGADATVNGLRANALFDQFFLSGLVPGVSPPDTDELVVPNTLLHPLARKRDGERVGVTDLRSAPAAKSSMHLLQRGAFNVNSTQAAAWAAVLRAGRLVSDAGFSFLNASPTTGSADDGNRASEHSTDARFFRFSQTAQEVFQADENYPQSTTSVTEVGPVIPTPLFRRGTRTLSFTEIDTLAQAIVGNIGMKHRASGPFQSLEAFLNPEAALAGQSVIEKAIADAHLNAEVGEFSSQWLTQADIVTAVAPLLSVRGDTFLVRAYGEAVNAVTGHAAGRAWCEALVQRLPEYIDPRDSADTMPAALQHPLNRVHGRRFKIVSFRWLTRADI